MELYSSLEYYVPVRRDFEASYDNYHFVSVDPDGKSRNLLLEEEVWLRNNMQTLEIVKKLEPKIFLDFGCGLGWLGAALSPDCLKYGLETSIEATLLAKRNYRMVERLEDLPKSQKFDVVLLNHVIEHLPDPVGTIDAIRAKMASNGHILISTPDFDSAMARRYGDRFRLMQDKTHISLFSTDSLLRLLRDSHFSIKRVEYPYFETRYFNREAIEKIFEVDIVSPPFYGSVVTVVAQRNE
jgi:2-polyprenyl-3-methyl-5-hydroxy-6-metoxy-1,4-benzoquinol methylase